MPVGVPTVPYVLPAEEEGEEEIVQWVDLFTRLYNQRILFLCQDLDDELGNQLMAIMLYMNGDEEDRSQFFMYINSPGGSVICGVGVYDVINYITPDVMTISVGGSASMASFVLSGGTRGKRISLPHSRIMIHQPEGGSEGPTSDILYEADEVLRIRRQVARLYADRTGQTLARISRDMDRDQFMSAEEAKEYGLVDLVVSRYVELEYLFNLPSAQPYGLD